jgi:hypothetical protein
MRETARRRSSFPGVQVRLVVVAHPLQQKSNPRSHYEREERTLWTPFRPG